MPWAEPAAAPPPAAPPPAAPVVSAKRVPWSWRKTPKPPVPPPPVKAITADRPAPGPATWALPKDAAAEAVAQTEMEFLRDSRSSDDNEPTAEQLVALLSKLPKRKPGAPEAMATPNAQTPYKARPISFEPTRWDIFTLWADAHRWHVGIGGVLFALALTTAYLLRLVSLNADLDRQWLQLEKTLRDRYALVPAYVGCLKSFTDGEHYALALTERRLAAWRTAHTEEQLVHAATELERSLTVLSRTMRRYDQEVPAKDSDQLDSSEQFARLEKQREQSRIVASVLVQRYNATVANYNAKVQSVPGSWIAWMANLHPHWAIFSNG